MHLSSKQTEASTLTNNTLVASRPFSTAKKSSKAVTLVSRPCSDRLTIGNPEIQAICTVAGWVK